MTKNLTLVKMQITKKGKIMTKNYKKCKLGRKRKYNMTKKNQDS